MSDEMKVAKPKVAWTPFEKNLIATVYSSPGTVWVTSNDHDDTLRSIARICKERVLKLWRWSAAGGLVGFEPVESPASADPDHFEAAKAKAKGTARMLDPASAIQVLKAFDNADEANKGHRVITILVIQDLDLFWDQRSEPGDVQRTVSAIRQFVEEGKKNNKVVIGLSHIGGQVHEKLQPLFTPVPHGLPTQDELKGILDIQVAKLVSEARPTVDDQRRILESGKGLTRLQFDNAVCESVARYRQVRPNYVWDFKVSLFNQEGLVEVHRGSKGFDAIGGQAGLKEIGKRLVAYMLRKPDIQVVDGVEPLGLLLAGPPGTGKTLYATCLGFETGLHTLLFDMGKTFGMWMGESEAKMDKALALFEAHAPAIVVIDEIGRMINSDNRSSAHNGGTESRVVGKFLTWLSSEKRKGLFIVGTTNDASGIQTLCRSGRFDMNVYTPLEMKRAQKDQIWDIYENKFSLAASQKGKRPRDDSMTPAEIEQVCKNAMMFGISLTEAAETITRVKETMETDLKLLDGWGRKFLISSETGRRFGSGDDSEPSPKKTRRSQFAELDDA